MSTLTLPRPAPEEAAPYYHGYIADVARLFGGLDDQAALARYAPGKWSIKEILGHLSDVERIFAYRLLRVARGDATPLPGFDENAFVPAGCFDQRPLRALMAEFRAVRLSTVALVSGVPAASWTWLVKASGKPVSARALAYIMVGHVTHHLGVLRERYGVGAGAAIAYPSQD
jgi:uncharacterized damage-inducible protein DinB